MKKGLLILFIISSSFNSKGTIHQISVWNGYYQFLPPNNITIQLGDTIQWIPLDPPTMYHTITSDNIPVGAVSFDQVWQMPTDTFFQYVPQVAGLYQYVCTPHIPYGMIGEFFVTNGNNTQTYVPDDNFEQELINQGYDDVLDDYVQTSNINTITHIHLAQDSISDLTGIEDFDSLATLLCYNNIMTSLDLSNNTALVSLDCSGNQLTSLDVRNGNNMNFLSFYCFNNPNLLCINVDDANWTTTNWTFANGNIDLQHYFSNNCSGPTSIQEHSTNKELIKITDVLGRETKGTKNEPLFYIYDDGTIEKKIIIE